MDKKGLLGVLRLGLLAHRPVRCPFPNVRCHRPLSLAHVLAVVLAATRDKDSAQSAEEKRGRSRRRVKEGRRSLAR
jgi:hypothetical protein